VNTVIEYAHKMGIKSTLQPYLSLGLGAFEVTPLELTAAYGVFANKGIRVEPYTIRTVTDIDGKLLEENRPIVQDVLRPENAFLVTNLLEGVVENGTGWRAKALERPAAAKTGTTNDFRDAWFIGYVPHLVAGVWVGYDDNRSLGENETGSRAAGPIWVDFMQNTLKKKPVEKFPVPENIVFVRINPETGKVPAEDKEGGPTIMEAFIKGTEPETGGEDIR
jgi:penicillin-binding protein 1A